MCVQTKPCVSLADPQQTPPPNTQNHTQHTPPHSHTPFFHPLPPCYMPHCNNVTHAIDYGDDNTQHQHKRCTAAGTGTGLATGADVMREEERTEGGVGVGVPTSSTTAGATLARPLCRSSVLTTASATTTATATSNALLAPLAAGGGGGDKSLLQQARGTDNKACGRTAAMAPSSSTNQNRLLCDTKGYQAQCTRLQQQTPSQSLMGQQPNIGFVSPSSLLATPTMATEAPESHEAGVGHTGTTVPTTLRQTAAPAASFLSSSPLILASSLKLDAKLSSGSGSGSDSDSGSGSGSGSGRSSSSTATTAQPSRALTLLAPAALSTAPLATCCEPRQVSALARAQASRGPDLSNKLLACSLVARAGNSAKAGASGAAIEDQDSVVVAPLAAPALDGSNVTDDTTTDDVVFADKTFVADLGYDLPFAQRKKLLAQIAAHGGKVAVTISSKVDIAVISEAANGRNVAARARALELPVVTPNFITACIAAGHWVSPTDFAVSPPPASRFAGLGQQPDKADENNLVDHGDEGVANHDLESAHADTNEAELGPAIGGSEHLDCLGSPSQPSPLEQAWVPPSPLEQAWVPPSQGLGYHVARGYDATGDSDLSDYSDSTDLSDGDDRGDDDLCGDRHRRRQPESQPESAPPAKVHEPGVKAMLGIAKLFTPAVPCHNSHEPVIVDFSNNLVAAADSWANPAARAMQQAAAAATLAAKPKRRRKRTGPSGVRGSTKTLAANLSVMCMVDDRCLLVPVIEAGECVPTRKRCSFTTAAQGQASVLVCLFEGPGTTATTALQLAEVAIAIPPGQPGSFHIRVVVDVLGDRSVQLSVQHGDEVGRTVHVSPCQRTSDATARRMTADAGFMLKAAKRTLANAKAKWDTAGLPVPPLPACTHTPFWYCGLLNTGAANALLKGQRNGTFVVRKDVLRQHQFVFSVVHDQAAHHVHVVRTESGLQVATAAGKEHARDSLPALVEYFGRNSLGHVTANEVDTALLFPMGTRVFEDGGACGDAGRWVVHNGPRRGDMFADLEPETLFAPRDSDCSDSEEDNDDTDGVVTNTESRNAKTESRNTSTEGRNANRHVTTTKAPSQASYLGSSQAVPATLPDITRPARDPVLPYTMLLGLGVSETSIATMMRTRGLNHDAIFLPTLQADVWLRVATGVRHPRHEHPLTLSHEHDPSTTCSVCTFAVGSAPTLFSTLSKSNYVICAACNVDWWVPTSAAVGSLLDTQASDGSWDLETVLAATNINPAFWSKKLNSVGYRSLSTRDHAKADRLFAVWLGMFVMASCQYLVMGDSEDTAASFRLSVRARAALACADRWLQQDPGVSALQNRLRLGRTGWAHAAATLLH
eukprot:m.459152 g.459152  ORF g.459152 m.459152 type:complete len:1341 (-) comp20339_c2_seq2:265-4287(-)